MLAPLEPVDHRHAREGGPRRVAEHLLEPGGLEVGLAGTARGGRVVQDPGLDDGHRLVVALGIGGVEVRCVGGGRMRTEVPAPNERLECAGPGQLVLPPRVREAPVIQAHADPVDSVVARVVRGVRVVGRREHPVAVGVQGGHIDGARSGLVRTAVERIAAALVRRPDHRRRRGALVDRRGDAPEGIDVGGRLLRPRVPRAVHLVSEADERRARRRGPSSRPAGRPVRAPTRR